MIRENIAISLALLFFIAPLGAEAEGRYSGKKILFVDSYHAGYAWSDGVASGLRSALKNTGVDLKYIEMDTKRNASEKFKQAAAISAKKTIEAYKPDVVIACDDNASKYLVMPYYKNADIPFVFCGVNWNASIYGYPYRNATGIVEIDFIPQIVRELGKYASGNRLGLLADDTLTSRKNARYHKEFLHIDYDQVVFVKTFEQWQKAYADLQQQVDRLIFLNYAGVADWDQQKALDYIRRNTRIPTGTNNTWTMPFTLFGIIKKPEEQGRWAARAALRILDGVTPDKIPISYNRESKLYFNRAVGKYLGFTKAPVGAIELD